MTFILIYIFIKLLLFISFFLFGVWRAKTLKVGKEIKTITFATPTVTSKTEQDSVKYQLIMSLITFSFWLESLARISY